MKKQLIDDSCEIAFLAKKSHTKHATQINQLLEVFESAGSEEAYTKLQLHVLYQASRDSIDKHVAKKLLGKLESIKNDYEEENWSSAVREFLLNLKYLFKVFEVNEDLTNNENNKKFANLTKNFANIQ